jgi:archaetidylinositol phosphate synthase
MLPQGQGKFTREAGYSLRSGGFVQDTEPAGKPPLVIVRSPLAVRIKDNLLAQRERDLLDWLCARMPRSITPDWLTGFGAAGAAVVFLGYAASPLHPAFFWLATFGLVMHWFGDSLDGSLARYRHIERQRYGYFLDFSVDVISSLLIMLGAGLSAYISLDAALFALAGYYMLWLFVLLNCQVSRNLQLSFLAAGPTEFRLVLIGLNCWMYFGGSLKMAIGPVAFSPFDLVFCSMGLVCIALFAVNVFKVARKLRLEE